MPLNQKQPAVLSHFQLALITALLGATILLISVGARQSYGLFLTPLSEKLNLGRESFSFAIALANLIWGLAAPVTGQLTDKYGPFWVLLVGTLCFAGGFVGLGLSETTTHLSLCGVLMGLGLGATGFTVVIGTVGRISGPQARDKMITLASVGSALGLCLAIPFAGWLLSIQSLEQAIFSIACVIMFIAVLTFPFAKLAKTETNNTVHDDGMDYIRHGLTNRNYLMLMAGFFVCGFHIAFTAVHLPAFLEDATGGPWLGTMALFLIGLGNVFGTFGAGMLGDRYSKTRLLSLIYFLRSIVFIGFLVLPLTPLMVYVLSFIMGVLWLGTVPLTSGLVAQLYGPKWLSMLFGIVFLSHQVGSFFGSWLGGLVFDLTSSYDLMWMGAAFLALLSTLAHLPIEEKLQFTSPLKSV